MADLPLFASVPRGLESLLAGELRSLGAAHVKQVRAGVSFAGSLETAYRACLWSRLAGRILLPLASGAAGDGDELYATARTVDWSVHLGAQDTLAVDFSGTNQRIRDTRYGGVRVKDAIVDQLREKSGGQRPSVDPRAPDVRVNAHLAGGRVTISLDLSGQSLHRRGYRADRVQVEAPLKENLAAAVLLYAAWPKEAADGASLLDPLCGSGTLPIEAALMAGDVAPGLVHAEDQAAAAAPGRPGKAAPAFGFLRWRGHDPRAWADLVAEARERRRDGLARLAASRPDVSIRGSDRDPHAVKLSRDFARRAGLHGLVAFEQAGLAEAAPGAEHGLLAANAPYGERLDPGEAEAVYRQLGERLRGAFAGWNAVVLAGDHRQLGAMGLTLKRETELRNGPLDCVLAYIEAGAAPAGAAAPRSARAAVRSAAPRAERAEPPAPVAPPLPPAPAPPATQVGTAGPESPPSGARGPESSGSGAPGPLIGGGAEYLANRLRKNQRRLARRLQRERISCYRLYDADLPEYNLVIDVYGDWVHIQEYAAPAEIDPGKAKRRLDEAIAVAGAVLGVPAARVVLKQRRRQRGAAQYERRADRSRLLPVEEDDLTYFVDLTSYLDTGFFIDQRMTRRLVRRLAGGRRFLNLFAYTGTMTVNALAAGALASTTVDLSSTYLAWAERNLTSNGFAAAREEWSPGAAAGGPAGASSPAGAPGASAPAPGLPHTLVQADCLRWIAEAEGQYDLVWLDPPTFSNSKRMGRATFDVQRDHADLIRLVARRLLAPDGVLLFATNLRNFRLERSELGGLEVKDLSRATLAFDCERGANRHHVFRVERRG